MKWAPAQGLVGLPMALLIACESGGAGSASDGGLSGSGGVVGTGGGGESGSGGGNAGTTGTTGVAGTTGAGGGAAPLSFEADIWPVFDQVRDPVFVYRGMGSYEGCTTAGPCHGSNTPGARLSMRNAATAYAGLVNVASVSSLCAGTIRVVPGDPDNSCLVLFYQGRLKDDLQWVGQPEIDLVRRWIADGARP